jgi:hypothetical protein
MPAIRALERVGLHFGVTEDLSLDLSPRSEKPSRQLSIVDITR